MIKSITDKFVGVKYINGKFEISEFLNYIRNLIKDIDPDTEDLMSDETIEAYVKFLQAKVAAMAEQQYGIDPSILTPEPKEEDNV